MRICIVGKYPPIQGGVSARTFRYAHALAERGHQVHVVTNAKEVSPPYRIFMREIDWARSEASYGDGSVRVHWTDPVDRAQWHIPMSSPFVTKLASLGIAVGGDYGIDVVYSFYMEPYAVAGHLIASMLKVPHVVKTAGSDAGRLWQNPQFGPLYDHIFRSADSVVAGRQIAERLVETGVERSRIRPDPDYTVDEKLFSPEGPALDVEALCAEAKNDPVFESLQWGRVRPGMTYFGVYGKLGETKGTFALLDAVARLVSAGRNVGLLVMGHDNPRSAKDFRAAATALSLEQHIVQIPFLPHWRVPEFIRRCLAVCCLEQGFPIEIHSPIIPREVLCCGGLLVASTEMIRKLPQPERLAHGYNCIAVKDVHDVDELSKKLDAAMDAGKKATEIGRRARSYVVALQRGMRFPERMERTLASAVGAYGGAKDKFRGKPETSPTSVAHGLTNLAVNAMTPEQRAAWVDPLGDVSDDPNWLRRLVERLDTGIEQGARKLAPIRDAAKFDIFIAGLATSRDSNGAKGDSLNSLFRFDGDEWASFPENFGELIPARMSDLSVQRFDYDINVILEARSFGTFPAEPPPRECYAVVAREESKFGFRTLVIDEARAALLDLCDGHLSMREIEARMNELGWTINDGESRLMEYVEQLFECGLIRLGKPERHAAVSD